MTDKFDTVAIVETSARDAAAYALGFNEKTARKEIETGKIAGARYGRNRKIPRWWIRQQRDGATARAA